jgi:hypothetical protein
MTQCKSGWFSNPAAGLRRAGELGVQESTVLKLKTLTGQTGQTHQGGGLMLWTLFKILMVVWMLQMVLQFGGSAIPTVLVVSLAALLLRLIFRRTSFS